MAQKPEKQILIIWRITLAFASLVPAALISVLFRIGSAVWIVASGLWFIAFLGIYLAYLPALYKNFSFKVAGDEVVLTTGVFSRRIIAMPISEIRFVSVADTVVSRIFGLSDVELTAAGGKAVLLGLKAADARALASRLTQSR